MRKLTALVTVLMLGAALLGCKSSSSGAKKATSTPASTKSVVSTPPCTPALLATPGVTPVAIPTSGPPPPVTAQPTTTPDGLQIYDVEPGSGAAATATGCVTVRYIGWLQDGTIFASSAIDGGPLRFPLTRVIKGWTEGVPGMKAGGQRRLIIPPDLAYGSKGSAPNIPPNATLTFDIELLSVP